MPKSYRSFDGDASGVDGPVDADEGSYAVYRRNTDDTHDETTRETQTPQSPLWMRRGRGKAHFVDERSSLLDPNDISRNYQTRNISTPGTPRTLRTPGIKRQHSYNGTFRHHTRKGSTGGGQHGFSTRLVNALMRERNGDLDTSDPNLGNSKHSFYVDDRVWYDQFTSIDWVHDSIADAHRVKALHARRDWRGRVWRFFDGAQGWLLVAIIGLFTACLAYFVTVCETVIFDYKVGYCSYSWSLNRRSCCQGATQCDEWKRWSNILTNNRVDSDTIDYVFFVLFAVLFALASCLLTLTTKTVVPSNIQISTLDENLGADDMRAPNNGEQTRDKSPQTRSQEKEERPAMVYYSAAGSGVAEIRVIVSGFVLHGYLGLKTLVIKSLALVLSIASGLSIGKEGPYVHIATCIGNICCRFFGKYRENDGKRREILSASAASGVAVAFGAPLSGVLFSLEEVSYYFPSKTLFRTFFCCMIAALSLKFLDPYGTGKIVIFQVHYITDWYSIEMVAFILLGILGGALGAFFIKATRIWATTFRRIPLIKKYPLVETGLIALITGLVTWWNKYTRLPVTELLLELASPCDTYVEHGMSMCPTKEHIPSVIWYLVIAFISKAVLTTISFGIKVPAGIYVPSMVVGGLLGRIVGHTVQYIALANPHLALFGSCGANGVPEDCVVPGVYALVAAGATMCGVTRLTVTLATILFELTGSLDHVLPFAIGVLVAKWTADAIEPLSIYDLLTEMNSYPFLDNKVRPVFTGELADIVPRRLREERIIDISDSYLVPARELRAQLEILHMAGEMDGGMPILKNGALVGLIPSPDLEFALDRLENEDNSLCLMSREAKFSASTGREHTRAGGDGEEEEEDDPTDFTAFIDPAPVRLDVHSPMDLVYECFVKLGLRFICVVREGKYAGMIHKKVFVKYCKDIEKHGHEMRAGH